MQNDIPANPPSVEIVPLPPDAGARRKGILARIKSSDAGHRLIIQGMLRVILFVAIGRLAGASKEMALAFRFGVGELTDTYVTLITFALWPVALWLTVVGSIIVPLESREENTEQVRRFRSELLGFALILGAAVVLIFFAVVLYFGGYGRDAQIDLPASMTWEMLWAGSLLAPLGLLIGLCSTWTLASGRHTNTLLEGIPALVVAVSILALPEMGAIGLVWASVAGFVAHLVLLSFPLARRGELHRPSFRQRSSLWRPFFAGFGLLLAGQAMMASVVIIDQTIALQLGSGAPSTLGYANRVLAFVMGLCALAVTRATLPVFSRAAEDPGRLAQLAGKWVIGMFTLGIAVAIISAWLSEPVVGLLFERGAFEHKDTVQVATVFRASLIQMPFFLAGLVLSSIASSRRRFGVVFSACACALIAKIAANALLVPNFGLTGLALGWTLMYGAHAAVLSWDYFRERSKALK